MPSLPPSVFDSTLGLDSLIRMRWAFIVGQVVVCLAAMFVLKIRLPVMILGGCLGFLAVSNWGLTVLGHTHGENSIWWITTALFLDCLLLTIMLYFAGGAHNPFTLFYLLLVILAVSLLPAWGGWTMVAACTGGFWLLFHSPHALTSNFSTCCNDMSAHLRGMVVALAGTGAASAWFVNRLARELQRTRIAVERAHRDGARARERAQVATMAASVAHELATPLGTIAMLSDEMATTARGMIADDAAQIRGEVDRCRRVIEKLGHLPAHFTLDFTPFLSAQLGKLLQPYLPESIADRLAVKVDDPKRKIHLAQDRLMQVLAILVKNAAEASTPDDPVVLRYLSVQGKHRFVVQDQGQGFSPEILSRIGEPLVSTKHDGLGLGLFLVKSFANDFGGTLDIQSCPRTGTVVTLDLPSVNPLQNDP